MVSDTFDRVCRGILSPPLLCFPTVLCPCPDRLCPDCQVCFSYATIKARRIPGKTVSDLPEIRAPGWDALGLPSENPAPPNA